ncbi:MAG: hypothetical protein A2098_02715 [Chlamydiae bacterium GWF2_49_8]|nr:MAG: hypothetical protein A2098_02715 [Chlamydiae bacterium GWF2_49_8]
MSNIQKTKKLGPRLTEKQKAFVHFLVQGLPRFNMTEAALEAGYSVNGARKQASRVWSYPHVKAYYSQLSVQYWKQQQMGSEEALARVAEIARTEWYKEGRIPLHTIRVDIDYAMGRAETTYGSIGVKVWINKGEEMETRAEGV